jgi:hypothetical protein
MCTMWILLYIYVAVSYFLIILGLIKGSLIGLHLFTISKERKSLTVDEVGQIYHLVLRKTYTILVK